MVLRLGVRAADWMRRRVDPNDAALLMYHRWLSSGNNKHRDLACWWVESAFENTTPTPEREIVLRHIRLAALADTAGDSWQPSVAPIRRVMRDDLDRLFELYVSGAESDTDEVAAGAIRCGRYEFDMLRGDPARADIEALRRWRNLVPRTKEADALFLSVDLTAALHGAVLGRAGADPMVELLTGDQADTMRRLLADDATEPGLLGVLGMTLFTVAINNEDLAMLTGAAQLLDRAATTAEPSQHEMFAAMARLVKEVALRRSGAPHDLSGVMAALHEVAESSAGFDLETSTQLRQMIISAVEADSIVPSSVYQLTSNHGEQVWAAIEVGDADALRTAIMAFDADLASWHAGDSGMVRALLLLGSAANELAILRTDDPDTADDAVRRNSAALTAASEEARRYFREASWQFAQALRLRGRSDDLGASRHHGLSSLDAEGQRVLVQAGTEHALVSARAAAEKAVVLAHWCAADVVAGADGVPGVDLVRALDTGRGLVLNAAVLTRSFTDRLTDLGRPDLAERWRDNAGMPAPVAGLAGAEDIAIPSDLRRQAMDLVLTADSGAARGSLDCPSSAEIGAALNTLDMDALVYLVPAIQGFSALAVSVTRDGAVGVRQLPELSVITENSPIVTYLRALDEWQRSDDPKLTGRWQDELDRLASWAWQAAGTVLLDIARAAARQSLPRLALVPFGSLAAVPWHCAGNATRYLAQDAMISVVPSARMLCAAAGWPHVAAGPSLVIGNPTEDLKWAGYEAHVIHEQFEPDATYLGRINKDVVATDGPATRADVLDWLAGHDRQPRRMLHLACHAHANAEHPTQSAIRLSDGDLTVATLLNTWPTTRLQLDTVILSACTTDVSSHNYDEAFSIATTFLALGARTTVGSLWAVADKPTAMLMYMFHHFLHGSDRPTAAQALHRTRLWMLDPNRRMPANAPTDLRTALRDDLARPCYWAAFNHIGA